MPTSARFRSLHPVHSEKRENTWSNLGQDASSVKNVVLANTVDSPTSGNQCSIGSHIKWLYVEFNLNGVDNSGTVQVFHWQIYKNLKGQTAVFSPATYDTVVKSAIVKRGMEMLPQIPIGSGGTVQTKRIFTIKIPKHFQRMADSDQFVLSYISTSNSAINFCGISIFKYIQ